jgi:DNA-binding Lrp family transcriptional regulator
MNKLERSCVKGRILNMAMLRSTGTPAELAEKLDISARTVKRIIKELREEGTYLRFDYIRRSYKLEEKE